MKKYLLLILTLSSIVQADVLSTFNSVMKQGKGPFTLNYLQGTSGRNEVNSGAPRGYLFQAAYRNDKAKELATQFDFYVGNLFTTNYYELMGEYVYNNPYGSHPVDHKALLDKKNEAIGKAASMVRNWALEKYYLEKLPGSALARAFQLRGISGSEFEQEYAVYFFNFYLNAINEDFQYLPAYLLVQKSPIGSSNSLEKARSLVADVYTHFSAKLGVNDKRVKALYLIRNAIHNQLSPDVITMIDKYDTDFPFYRKEGNTQLFEIKKILVDYYSVGASKIVALATKLKLENVKSAAEAVVKENSLKNLYTLSEVVADLKAELKNAEVLTLISKVSELLGKEISALHKIEEVEVFKIILNVIYIEGFLIKDNWEYFKTELAGADTVDAAKKQMEDVLSIGMDTLDSAFNPASNPTLNQWITVEPIMQNFRDDTIKSSSLNLISLIDQKMKLN
jgi:hypothetical protein